MVICEPLQTEDPETGLARIISRQRYEIVKEKLACLRCASIQRMFQPQVVETKEEVKETIRVHR